MINEEYEQYTYLCDKYDECIIDIFDEEWREHYRMLQAYD